MKTNDPAKSSGQEGCNKLNEQINELRVELESCHLLLDSTYDWETFNDSEGRIVYCSPSCERITGHPPDHFLTNHNLILDIVHPEDRAVVARHLHSPFATTGPDQINFRVVRPDGEVRHIIHCCQPVYNKRGYFIGRRASHRDETAGVIVQERLRESEARYRIICNAITDYTYTAQIENGRVVATHHNPTCLSITGYSPEEFVANPFLWILMVVTADRPAVKEQARLALVGEKVPPLEHRITRKDGAERWFKNTILLQHDQQGQLVAYEGLIQDITDRKGAEIKLAQHQANLEELVGKRTASLQLEIIQRQKAEQEVMQSRKQYVDLYRKTPALLHSLGVDGRIRDVSDLWLTTLGYEREEVLGRQITEFMSEQSRVHTLPDNWPVFLQTGSIKDIPFQFLKKNGQQLDTLLSGIIERDAEGNFLRTITVLQDMSEAMTAKRAFLSLEQRHADLVTAAPLGVFRSTSAGKLLDANPALAAMLGYDSPGELIETVNRTSIPELLFFHPEEYASMAMNASQSAAWLESESQYRRRDGSGIVGRLRYQAVKTNNEIVGFAGFLEDISERRRIKDVLSFLAQGSTSHEADFFPRLARYLAVSLDMDFICIDSLAEDGLSAQTLAMYFDGHFKDNISYTLQDTPCGEVVDKSICCYTEGVRRLFPKDAFLQEMDAESYVGTILTGSGDQPIGLLAAIGRKPLANPELAEKIIRLVSTRAAAELERQMAEDTLRSSLNETSKREQEIAGLLLAARTVLEEKSFKEGVRAIFDICLEKIGATAGYVAILSKDGKTNEVLFLESGNLTRNVDPHLSMPIRGLPDQAYTEGCAVYDNDFTNSLSWQEFMPAGHMTIANVLFAPMLVNGVACGIIGIANKPGGFTDADARLAAAFGELAAVALNNSINRDLRARAEEALQRSEQRLLTLFEYSPIAIWEEDFSLVKKRFNELAAAGVSDWQAHFAAQPGEVANCAGLVRVLDINKTSCRLFAAESKEEISRQLPLYFTAESLAVFGEELVALAAGQTLFAREIPIHIPKSGEIKILFLSLAVVPGFEQDLNRVLVSFIDITDRKRTEHELAMSAERFETILRSSLDGFWITDSEGRIMEANHAYCLMSGYSREELLQLKIADLEAIESAAEVESHILALIASGYVCFETRHRRKDGSLFDVDVSAHSLRGGEQLICFCRDITDRKQAESELRQVSTRLTLAVRASGVGVWDYDIVNNILLWDEQMLALYGVDKDTFGGVYEAWRSGIHPDDKARSDAEIMLAIRGKKEFDTEFRVVWPDSSVHNIRALAIVQRDDSGQPLHMIGTNWDITSHKQNEEELRHAKDVAESASRAKSEFLANMSHEIRTPMNAIIGFSDLALGTEMNPKLADYLEKISSSAHSLLGVINDILDFSKIEANRLNLEQLSFNISEVVDILPAMFSSMAFAKNLEFLIDCGPDIPLALIGDPFRLRQILINLVSNAIKFTEQGSVLVAIELAAKSVAECRLRITVQDTGIGISAEQIEHIFLPFVQADASMTRQYGGTGLGLSISCRLAKIMGGNLEVNSVVGQGSTFSLTLPFRIEAKATDQHPDRSHQLEKIEDEGDSPCRRELKTRSLSQELVGARILLVEDNSINQRVALEILAGANLAIEVAANGLEAIKAVENNHYDAVLMDIQMPVMDGLTATEIIRRRLGRLDLPIIAMTAHAMDEHRQKCLDAGMNDFVSKPIDGRQLLTVLQGWIGPGGQGRPGPLPTVMAIGQQTAVGPEESGGGPDDISPQIDMLDLEDGLQRLMGNRPLYLRLLGEFSQEYADSATAVRALCKQGQIEEARRLVHTIKGIAGNLGAHALQRGSIGVEVALKDGHHADLEEAMVVYDLVLHGLLEAIQASMLPVTEPWMATTGNTPPRQPDQQEGEELAQHLQELDDQLAQNLLSAAIGLETFAERFGVYCDQKKLLEMRQCLNRYDFRRARENLAAIRRSLEHET